MLLLSTSVAVAAQSGDGWRLVERVGLVQLVRVDAARIADAALYADAIEALCAPVGTCSIRFYSFPENTEAAVSLAERMSRHSTAWFSRSVRQYNQVFQFSCRVRSDPGHCF